MTTSDYATPGTDVTATTATTSGTGGTTETAKQTAQTAKQQAGEVAGTATSAAADVAGTAKEQAGQVVGEAVGQAQDLVDQTREQLTTQASEQTQRLAGNLRQLAEQLSGMARQGEPGTTAQSLVQQLAERGHRAAGYLEGKEPGDLVADLQSLGRRKPGAFLLGAALAGVAVGRLAAAKRAQSGDGATTGVTTGTPAAGYAATSETTGPGGTTALYPNATPVRENVPPGAQTVEPAGVDPYPATTTTAFPTGGLS